MIYAHRDLPPSNFPEGFIVVPDKAPAIYFSQQNCAGTAYMQRSGCVGKIRFSRLLHPAPWSAVELWSQTSASTSTITAASRRDSGGTCVNSGATVTGYPVQVSAYQLDVTSPWDVEVF